ncbi:helix-turn-helix domain-containing protein [Streptomyces sp. SLBN-115]|uniref:helix-turn-helix domain-containing protein n=1 Tax=Streptomyces sp. SLBN-115 TaxID=2768453 RepID=UPI003FCE3EA7
MSSENLRRYPCLQAGEDSGPCGRGQGAGIRRRDGSGAVTCGFGSCVSRGQFVSVPTGPAKRAFKYRFYPTDAQAADLARTFGCVRKVYNLALAARSEAWARQERVGYHQTSAWLTAWFGREVIAVDRFFPSSKLCSACGALAEELPLKVRVRICDGCGATHDRDVNAAKNLLTAGLAVSVCGAGARPHGDLRAGSRLCSRNPYGASRRNPPRSRGGGQRCSIGGFSSASGAGGLWWAQCGPRSSSVQPKG